VIREAFRQVNQKLDDHTRIDCMMSGTTCVMLLLYRNLIVSANVGDSRAVMFTQLANGCAGGSVPSAYWKATPLSRDHKPEDPEEAARIKQSGGRIEQSKLLPGLFGKAMIASSQYYGPKRVWLKNKQVPGLAMTRSLGDFVAKTVGVTFEPEIKVFANLLENDKALVVASDGIWDRIPNDEIAAIVRLFHERRDANGASKELTRVAVERW
jgi:serine/threonine protein phosphatase PrpC